MLVRPTGSSDGFLVLIQLHRVTEKLAGILNLVREYYQRFGQAMPNAQGGARSKTRDTAYSPEPRPACRSRVEGKVRPNRGDLFALGFVGAAEG